MNNVEVTLSNLNLNTVCQSARCPNIEECFGENTATFMIMGTICTRHCKFCAVEKGVPERLDEFEPQKISLAVKRLELKHVVITSVTRDDLFDGGAQQYIETINLIRSECEDVTVEILVPDFGGSLLSLQKICNSQPNIFNHNIETVPRLYDRIRPGSKYTRSLAILEYAHRRGLKVKSGLMMGLGEEEHEILKTISDLKLVGCQILTIGQYLRPTKCNAPVMRYIEPDEFIRIGNLARSIGIANVISEPFARSSYKAANYI